MTLRQLFYLVSGGILIATVCLCVLYSKSASSAKKTLARAAYLLQIEQPAQARKALATLRFFRICDAETSHLLGLSYLAEEDTEKAIDWLSQVPAGASCADSARIDLASALIAERRLDNAEDVLQRHLQLTPDSLTAVRMLSGIMLTELRQDEAIQLLEELLRSGRSSISDAEGLRLLLQDISHAEFHPPHAETVEPTLEEANTQQPQQLSVVLTLARIYWQTGRVAQGRALLAAALETHNDNMQCRMVACEFMIEQDEFNNASQLLGDSAGELMASKWQRTFWILKCRVAEGLMQYDDALNYLTKAESIRILNSKELTRRARILRRAGKESDAKATYQLASDSAEIDLQLWRLSRDIGSRQPSADECLEMARLYEKTQRPLPASGWTHLSEYFVLPAIKKGDSHLQTDTSIVAPNPK